MAIQFSLAGEAIDPSSWAPLLQDFAAGAVVTFEGRVRNHNAGQAVRQLEYQVYPALAISTGQRILDEEVGRHGLLAAVAVHRTGKLDIGEVAVWVAVASAHRDAAFDAARTIMERLKYELPIWKKEIYRDGRVEWVGPDNKSATTGRELEEVPCWQAKLLKIWISPGNDFRGRHLLGRLDHGMESRDEIECIAGMGLRGDRYFGYKPDYKGQVSFFAAETVDEVREMFSQPEIPSSIFRRNLIVSGVDLGAWIGRRFRFQGIEFEGSEECKPCYWMNEAVAPGAEEFLKQNCRGGLRARILSDGILQIS